jgi:hypothetical protein
MKGNLFKALMMLIIPISLISCNNDESEKEQFLTSKMDSLKDSLEKIEEIVNEDIDKVQAYLKRYR